MKKRARCLSNIITMFILLFAIIMVLPILKVVFSSFGIFSAGFTIKGYIDFYVWEPEYIEALLRSLSIAMIGTAISIILSIPAAYTFAKVPFKGSRVVFFLYIVVMIMPFQVTLLPHFILFKDIRLYDNIWSLILLCGFSPFSVFFLTQAMRSIPDEIIEAAKLETSSTVLTLLKIIIPSMKPSIVCCAVLVFSEEWNKLAEPQALLESTENFPMSMLLSTNSGDNILTSAAIVIFMLFPLLLFAFFEDEIIDGLQEYSLKTF